MKSTDLPFNIKLMDVSGKRLDVLRPVKSLDIYEGITNNFHDDGLFSIPIFGRLGDDVRDKKFSFINIRTQILHPIIYTRLIKLKGLYEEILNGRGYAKWDTLEKDFVRADELEGDTGYSFFMSHWRDIKFKRTGSVLRDDKIKLIEKYKDVALVDKILVLPAGLRDFEVDAAGRARYDDVNSLYFRLMSIANTIVSNKVDENLPILNNPRYSLQLVFNEIFAYFENILSGKNGFLQSKWGSRRIFNGTRNVISSMDPSSDFLGAANQPGFTDSVLGIYQLCKAALPLTIHYLKSGFLSQVFTGPEQKVPLVDPNTLALEYINVPADVFDQWNTMEGLEKVINNMSQVLVRHRPIEIENRHLGLIYIGPDSTFKIFNDIRDLPDTRDIKDVHPLTLCQLIYLSGYKEWNKLRGLLTRYPITGIDSIYPSTIYVKTTIKGEVRYELNDSWELTDEAKSNPVLEFPTAPFNYVDTLIPHFSRLSGIGGDYDGDVCSLIILTTDESIAEVDAVLSKKEAYLNTSGGFRASANVDTVAHVLRSMTGT